MADINSLVRRIRSRVHDTVSHHESRDEGRPVYLDNHYIDSVYSGLGRINLDLDSAYTIDLLPTKYEYLLEVRGTINMCYVRGGEGASGDVEDFPNVPDQIVTVPQLTVQRQQMPLEGPKYWLKLAEKLEDEYNNALLRLQDRGDEGAGIQQAVMTRMSLRTGRRMSYMFDDPIAVPDFAIALSGSSVKITWGRVQDAYFNFYHVERAVNNDFSTSSAIFTTSDNQISTFTDTPVAGEWYYRLVVVNSNDLKSYSQASSVVVV